jgi:hypothetical protein
MSILQFLMYFFGILYAGHYTIMGWYHITRGKEEVQEDGTIKRTGKLFKGWYFFWTQKHRAVEYKVVGRELDRFYDTFLVELTKLQDTYDFKFYNWPVDSCLELTGGRATIERIEEVMAPLWSKDGMSYTVGMHGNGALVFFYKKKADYRFPLWLRDPLAQCPTCFASIYGTLFYLFAILLPGVPLFCWSNHPILAGLFCWVVFCFSIAYLNTEAASKK